MKRNVGTIDAIFRITIGLFGLAWAVSRTVSNPRRKFPKMIAFFSAVKAAEGATRFCPGLALFGLSTQDSKQQTASRSRQAEDTEMRRALSASSRREEREEPYYHQ
ncbi:hypothetical protein BEP19_15515 [Ammoniphilus oxalaticus]|uniref:Inner membrane protein YgaP-like transmembrane domain-containing protein n=1 Tax=Ammoniphilus oxalaticus TaxID=66863 RepID=A0A419SDB8_9BACL|nr:DUF2892 domain-containing protein [Ammoniphilus oxalaticus]RKD21084.1 hypothetical protein BEP19_15515 [Ammoniphilus oxalaticus]